MMCAGAYSSSFLRCACCLRVTPLVEVFRVLGHKNMRPVIAGNNTTVYNMGSTMLLLSYGFYNGDILQGMRPRWLGRWSACLSRSISWVQVSPSVKGLFLA